MNETTITLVGNAVADPELRYTPTGAPVANFRVASTTRSKTDAAHAREPDQLPHRGWLDRDVGELVRGHERLDDRQQRLGLGLVPLERRHHQRESALIGE
jgi:hypothetical protein